MNLKTRKTPSGLTAPELVMGIGVFSIILIVIISTYFAYTNVFRVQKTRQEIQNALARALNVMSASIQSASTIPSSQTVNGFSYTTDRDTLILKTPSIDVNEEIIINAFDYLVYDFSTTDPKMFVQHTEAAPGSIRKTGTIPITDMVSRISFQYTNADVTKATDVTIILTLSKTANSTTVSFTNETNARLRNK